MEIRELLKQTDRLPNVPDVVRQLIQQLNNPAADYGEIAKKVSNDQTLSLKILRLVNSAHFGLSRKVSSIEQAVVMLGMVRLKTLVIASGIAGSVQEVKGIDLKKFWSDAFQVAALSKWFAEQGSQINPDVAFTAGLIHNIGQLLLHLADPIKAQAIQALIEESNCSRDEAEKECFGFTSQEAGQALLNMWKFPKELGEAVLQYKHPASADNPSPLAAIVNLATLVHLATHKGESAEILQAKFPEDIAVLAGISSNTCDVLEEALILDSGLSSLA
ncbi:HDOD domain-containing protein [Neptuniibacter sp. 1_MG-2023]|uniref:HDOD domain-containing protein n=1 Tax=Neptuniibacter sp. 1_MG-2023 TaxID=3062662 RepID=UPI0026E46624|nr:HDOD domain-containing protein [Neptuniibacter sp. 1_MG-2023]MDO6593661.1 HDOD domain-containing protein [Neptuniibacter sp. 1_MG-2023]